MYTIYILYIFLKDVFYIYLYIYIIFIHSSADGHSGCLPILAILYSAAINIGMHICFQTIVLPRCVPRSGIAGSGFNPFLREVFIHFPSYLDELGIIHKKICLTN